MIYLASVIFILIIELIILVIVVIVGGVSALCGASFGTVFRAGLWALLLPIVLLVYGIFVERNVYHVENVEIVSDRLPAAFDGYRIVQFSDAHLSSFQKRPRSLGRAVAKMNALEPDLIAFTGDIVTISPDELNDTLAGILSGLSAPDGVISIVGNHDYCGGYGRTPHDSTGLNLPGLRKVIAKEKAMGWRLLQNENVNISRGSDTISIIGTRNWSASVHFPHDGDIDKAMEGATGAYRILLSHDPTHWKAQIVERNDIDLMLSGHTHSMQLSIFGWSPCSWFYKEFRGLYSRDTLGRVSRKASRREQSETKSSVPQYLYVNIGLGETAVPARVGARPEITLITLRKK